MVNNDKPKKQLWEVQEEKLRAILNHGDLDDEIIEFLKPYQKIPIETIFRHLQLSVFGKRRPYIRYDEYMRSRNPFDRVRKIEVEKLIIIRLEHLIALGKIPGYIRSFGDVICYLVYHSATPSNIDISTIKMGEIGDMIVLKTRTTSITAGERRFCPRCGTKIAPDGKTCPLCARPLDNPKDYS